MAGPVSFEEATTPQAAGVFGVTTEALNQWRATIDPEAGIWWEVEGKGRGGKALRWNIPKLVEWRVKRLAETMAAREAKALNPLEQEQLLKLQIANGKARQEILDQLGQQWSQIGGTLRGRLEAIGRRHGAAVSADLAKAMADLTREVHGVMGPKA